MSTLYLNFLGGIRPGKASIGFTCSYKKHIRFGHHGILLSISLLALLLKLYWPVDISLSVCNHIPLVLVFV